MHICCSPYSSLGYVGGERQLCGGICIKRISYIECADKVLESLTIEERLTSETMEYKLRKPLMERVTDGVQDCWWHKRSHQFYCRLEE